MAKKNQITELSEILSTAVAGRPDLKNRLSSLLGTTPKSGDPGKEVELTHKQRKQIARNMLTGLSFKEDLKKLTA